MSAASQILELQRFQNRHDAGYHPDIVALDTARRVKHMTLHQTKYAARFIAAEEDGDEALFARTLTDAAIISVATANVLVQDLRRSFAEAPEACGNLAELGSMLLHSPRKDQSFMRRFSEQTGAMAKACESLDHLEDFPFRRSLLGANAEIFGLLVETAAARQLDLAHLYRARLDAVESGSARRLLAE
ncbi:MAG: hypothetical protein WA989_04740 [Henriciella sp.]|uniref:hypothetical protein n=1 Tax=Henriciella sp. TaxID=1968823 RepID=UPI003C71933D